MSAAYHTLNVALDEFGIQAIWRLPDSPPGTPGPLVNLAGASGTLRIGVGNRILLLLTTADGSLVLGGSPYNIVGVASPAQLAALAASQVTRAEFSLDITWPDGTERQILTGMAVIGS